KQRDHHPGVERRLPPQFTLIMSADGGQVERGDGINHEVDQIALRQPVARRGRKHIDLVRGPLAVGFAHAAISTNQVTGTYGPPDYSNPAIERQYSDRLLDLVAISSLSAQVRDAYRLADRFRARGVPVVMGGLHATVLPEEAAEHCDAVVVGEGEASWQRLPRDAEAGQLCPVYRPSAEFPLEEAPRPAFELVHLPGYQRLTVQVSRGCPYRCEFCASSILLTPDYKMKPIAKVLEEIDRIREIWPRPFLEFADDNALVHRRYWKRLLAGLKSRKLRWFAETDVSIHEDDELLDLMRESGCVEVLIG